MYSLTNSAKSLQCYDHFICCFYYYALSQFVLWQCTQNHPTPFHAAKVNQIILDLYTNKLISNRLKTHLWASNCRTSKFYLLPKIHKLKEYLRPAYCKRHKQPNRETQRPGWFYTQSSCPHHKILHMRYHWFPQQDFICRPTTHRQPNCSHHGCGQPIH